MKKINIKNLLATFLLAIVVIGPVTTASAQRGGVKTDSRILYHGGQVMAGLPAVYVVWYGNWSGNTGPVILTDLITSLGSTPYFLINTGYTDTSGATPSGGLIYAGSVDDPYSHGATLTDEDIAELIAEHIASGTFLLDPNAVYLIFGSADVTHLRPDGSSYCTPGAVPYHGASKVSGTMVKFGFVGSPARCPSTAGAHFPGLLTPNDNFTADAMATHVASLISRTVTNPLGDSWYDRYGLENASKCAGSFGATYTTSNGARANIRLGQRDFLIQQNWVNDRKGRCGLSAQ